jgi:anti-sigma regulatory factor (Ser/Thr protein kinase)
MEKRSLPAVLDSLAEIRRYVKEAADRAGIEAARAYQLQLAVDEIATNIITHGYEDAGASAVISIGSEASDDALVITLEDQAPAFDPRTMEMPEAEDLAKPLEERRMGGLGIYIASKAVDRFDYRHDNSSNINIFEVRRHHG